MLTTEIDNSSQWARFPSSTVSARILCKKDPAPAPGRNKATGCPLAWEPRSQLGWDRRQALEMTTSALLMILSQEDQKTLLLGQIQRTGFQGEKQTILGNLGRKRMTTRSNWTCTEGRRPLGKEHGAHLHSSSSWLLKLGEAS